MAAGLIAVMPGDKGPGIALQQTQLCRQTQITCLDGLSCRGELADMLTSQAGTPPGAGSAVKLRRMESTSSLVCCGLERLCVALQRRPTAQCYSSSTSTRWGCPAGAGVRAGAVPANSTTGSDRMGLPRLYTCVVSTLCISTASTCPPYVPCAWQARPLSACSHKHSRSSSVHCLQHCAIRPSVSPEAGHGVCMRVDSRVRVKCHGRVDSAAMAGWNGS